MLGKIKDKLTQVFLGDLVHDWGVISDRSGGAFDEQISLALYRKDGVDQLCLTYTHKSSFNLNKQLFSFPVADLRAFAAGLTERWAEYDKAISHPRPPPTVGPNKLPFFHRLVLSVIHGIKLSRLLVEHEHQGDIEMRLYAYLTRGGDTKVFLQTDIGISQNKGHVISGEGIRVVSRVLNAYVDG